MRRGVGIGTEVSAEKRVIVSLTIQKKIVQNSLMMEAVKIFYAEKDTKENKVVD